MKNVTPFCFEIFATISLEGPSSIHEVPSMLKGARGLKKNGMTSTKN